MLRVDSGEIGLSSAILASLLNNNVFAYPRAPLKGLKVRIANHQAILKGTLRKGVDVPFEMMGTVTATPEGKIRLHTLKVKPAHLPVKGLMDLLDIKVSDLVNLEETRGIKVEGNDLILDPERIGPPPRLQGKVQRVRLEGDQMILSFEKAPGTPETEPLRPPCSGAVNYMYLRGGTLRFGKLTMRDADLQLIDAEPRDYFYFSLDKYNQQLVAGYSRNRPNYGLLVFMPDFNTLGSRARQARVAHSAMSGPPVTGLGRSPCVPGS
jgi:hypothetical protein